MAAVAAASESDEAAAREPTPTPAPACFPRAILDPLLLMAALRGDSKLLKGLLQIREEDANAVRNGVILETNNGVRTNEGDLLLQVVDSVIEVLDDDQPSPSPSSASRDDDAPPPPPTVEPLDEDGVTMEGDSLLHVVAASGDTQEYLDCAKMIVREKKRKGGARAARLALEARNNKCDTPLHCAAGAGNADMIGCVTDLVANTVDDDEAAAEVKKAFLRMQNEVGETALHQAVRAANSKVACIDQLMAMDSELACIPRDDEDGASPLYLAISLGEVEIAQHLYSKSKGKLSYSGPDGRNVLHAAVHRGQALPMVLKWLKDRKPKDEDSSSVPLVSRLSSQRDRKQKGSTPLHLAASLGGWLDSLWFPQVWAEPEAAATLLLDANLSTAYQADHEGSYPIHVAARSNSGLGVVKLLQERCPDCATLRDGKGRTFLHVAAEKECLAVVGYAVWGEMSQRLSSMILNAQDSNGDTALHVAVRAGNLAVFNCLFRNQRVRLDVENKDRMTPLDLSNTRIPQDFNYVLNPRNIVRSSLRAAGAPHGGCRWDFFHEEHIPKRDVDKESKKHTEATQVMSIVTALIATVTFASAFTFPGGYRAEDGQPALAGSYTFDAFILADTLAFICSIAATCTLVYAGLPAMDISLRNWYFNVSAVLLQSAARSLVAAFGLGLCLLVQSAARWSVIAACAIVFASLLYGNMGAWRIINMARTVLARIGKRRYVVAGYARSVSLVVLVHFSSYVIIFGLPVIWKWVIPAIWKWISILKRTR